MLLSFHIVFIHSYFGYMTFTKNQFQFFSTLLVFFFLLNACSNTYIDQVDRGEGYKYRPGYPELRVVASGFIDQDDQAYINVASEIVYGSLVFKKRDSLFVASGTVSYQIINLDNPENIIDTKEYPVRITDRTNKLSFDQDTYQVDQDFEVNPGNYQIITTFTDQNTSKQTDRTTTVFIPDPSDNANNITNIRILKKADQENAGFLPVTTYDIQNDIDSVKFVFQITNNNASEPLTINTKLLKFESDTNFARPMNFNDYSPSSIEYEGIDFSDYEEINSNRRVLTNQGNVLIEFTFPKLERGNYRFEAYSNRGEDNELYKARDFSIKSAHYPSISTAKEFAKPLYYLMTKKEFENLMSIEDNFELKKAIDRFWLSNIKNSQIAKSVVELFYLRVEEANKQFSSYKEGWRTDRGMIYILFGPPWYLDESLNTKVWSYSYNSQDFDKNFFFTAPRLKSKFYPFENYLLQRSSGYSTVYYQQIEYWRSGLILKRDL